MPVSRDKPSKEIASIAMIVRCCPGRIKKGLTRAEIYVDERSNPRKRNRGKVRPSSEPGNKGLSGQLH
jgi:hypothetical protein